MKKRIVMENRLYRVIYRPTIERLRNVPLHEQTHRPMKLIMKGLYPMNEAGINRILSHGKYGFIVVSSNRSAIYLPQENLDLTQQCNDELAIIFKMVLGLEITNEERNSVQYDGFDYRADKLVKYFTSNCNVKNIKTAVEDEGNREQWLKVRNEWADKALLEDIKKAGYAWSKALGGFHDKSAVIDSYEPNYIVYNHERMNTEGYQEWENLYNFAVAMCGKYKQESVYVQAPDEAPKWVNSEGQVVSKRSSKDFKINRENEMFYTTDKRKKNNPHRFTADIEPMDDDENISEAIHFEDYLMVSGPATHNGHIRRTYFGEVFLKG